MSMRIKSHFRINRGDSVQTARPEKPESDGTSGLLQEAETAFWIIVGDGIPTPTIFQKELHISFTWTSAQVNQHDCHEQKWHLLNLVHNKLFAFSSWVATCLEFLKKGSKFSYFSKHFGGLRFLILTLLSFSFQSACARSAHQDHRPPWSHRRCVQEEVNSPASLCFNKTPQLSNSACPGVLFHLLWLFSLGSVFFFLNHWCKFWVIFAFSPAIFSDILTFLVQTRGQAPKTLDPTFPIMQQNSALR